MSSSRASYVIRRTREAPPGRAPRGAAGAAVSSSREDRGRLRRLSSDVSRTVSGGGTTVAEARAASSSAAASSGDGGAGPAHSP
jgi:hypothetical protein